MGRTPAGETRDRVFRFVRDRLFGGLPPTVREVQEAFGFRSPQTAREHLEGLVERGRLTKEPGKARGYRLPARAGAPPVLVPLLGRVPAGPLDAARGRRSPDGLRFSAWLRQPETARMSQASKGRGCDG